MGLDFLFAGFLSTNTLDYCYTFRQKVLLRKSSLSPWRFLTGVAMEYVLRYASASPSGTASASDLVSPRFPRLLLHGNFLSQKLCGYAFKTHISSSPNRSDSFMKRMAHFQEVLSLLRLELIASMFFLRCCSARQWCLLRHKRFLSKRSYQHETGIIKLIAACVAWKKRRHQPLNCRKLSFNVLIAKTPRFGYYIL